MQKNNDLNFKIILLIEKIDVKTKRILRLKNLIAIDCYRADLGKSGGRTP